MFGRNRLALLFALVTQTLAARINVEGSFDELEPHEATKEGVNPVNVDDADAAVPNSYVETGESLESRRRMGPAPSFDSRRRAAPATYDSRRRAAPAPVPSSDRRRATPVPVPSSDRRRAAPAPVPSSDRRRAAPAPVPSSDRRRAIPAPVPSSDRRRATPAPVPSSDRRRATPAPVPSSGRRRADYNHRRRRADRRRANYNDEIADPYASYHVNMRRRYTDGWVIEGRRRGVYPTAAAYAGVGFTGGILLGYALTSHGQQYYYHQVGWYDQYGVYHAPGYYTPQGYYYPQGADIGYAGHWNTAAHTHLGCGVALSLLLSLFS